MFSLFDLSQHYLQKMQIYYTFLWDTLVCFFFHKKYQRNFAISFVYSTHPNFAFHFKTSPIRFAFCAIVTNETQMTSRNDYFVARKDKKFSGIEIVVKSVSSARCRLKRFDFTRDITLAINRDVTLKNHHIALHRRGIVRPVFLSTFR